MNKVLVLVIDLCVSYWANTSPQPFEEKKSGRKQLWGAYANWIRTTEARRVAFYGSGISVRKKSNRRKVCNKMSGNSLSQGSGRASAGLDGFGLAWDRLIVDTLRRLIGQFGWSPCLATRGGRLNGIVHAKVVQPGWLGLNDDWRVWWVVCMEIEFEWIDWGFAIMKDDWHTYWTG